MSAFDGRYQTGNVDGASLQLGVVGHEPGTHLIDRVLHGFPKNRLLEVAAAEVGAASTEAMPVAATAEQRRAFPRGFPLTVGNTENLAAIDVHHAGVDGDDGLALFLSEAADAESAETAAGATDIGVLGFVAELRDAANNDGVHSEELPDLGGRGCVGAIAIGEILLGENLVQCFALNDGIGAVLDEIGDQQVGDPLADVHIGAEERGGGSLHGGIVEIENGHALFASLRRGRYSR